MNFKFQPNFMFVSKQKQTKKFILEEVNCKTDLLKHYLLHIICIVANVIFHCSLEAVKYFTKQIFSDFIT